MAYQVHQSARPTNTKNLWWMKKSNLNPFVEYDLRARMPTTPTPDTSRCSDLISDFKFGTTAINPLGEVVIKPKKFLLILDMLHFQPNDINIRAVQNGFYVRAAHPELVDGKEYITHHFYREYLLPHDISPSQVVAWMTEDNLLIIEAPKIDCDSNESDEEEEPKKVQVIRRNSIDLDLDF